MVNRLQIFLHTVHEYDRFARQLPINKNSDLNETYDEANYIGIQTRLMLLRKYFNNKGSVGFKYVVTEAQKAYPARIADWQRIANDFNEISLLHLQHILADGTKQSLYDTIEDTVYGLYLHADGDRIIRLMNTQESIRFTCVRQYVLSVESLVLELAKILEECGVTTVPRTDKTKAPVLYMGDPKQNTQDIHASPYWGNIYGHDATNAEITNLIANAPLEDNMIILHCLSFMTSLLDDSSTRMDLKSFIHPIMRWNWGDFSVARNYFKAFPNPGWSSKVRYNDKRTRAYVRIYPKVDGAFVLDTPHLISEIGQFVLAKSCGKWCIFAYEKGSALDNIL